MDSKMDMSTFRGHSPSPKPAKGESKGEDASRNRIAGTQKEVDQVVDMMKINLQKIADRDVKLVELGERAENLDQRAKIFNHTSVQIKRKHWYQNAKMTILLSVILLIVILIIALVIVLTFVV